MPGRGPPLPPVGGSSELGGILNSARKGSQGVAAGLDRRTGREQHHPVPAGFNPAGARKQGQSYSSRTREEAGHRAPAVSSALARLQAEKPAKVSIGAALFERPGKPEASRIRELIVPRELKQAVEDVRDSAGPGAKAAVDGAGLLRRSPGGGASRLKRSILPVGATRSPRREEKGHRDPGVAVAPGRPGGS